MLKGAYGFIDFETEESAQKAADEMHLTNIFGEGRVTVEMAKYKARPLNLRK